MLDAIVLRDLIAELPDTSTLHCSLVGSIASSSLTSVDDIDFYVVLSRTTTASILHLCSLFGQFADALFLYTHCPWHVETRRGPFKPDPLLTATRQIHLIIDDLVTIQHTTPLALSNWATTGVLCFGRPIETLLSEPLVTLSNSSYEFCAACNSELDEIVDMVERKVIIYKQWNVLSDPKLVEVEVPLATHWEYRTLLRYANRVLMFILVHANYLNNISYLQHTLRVNADNIRLVDRSLRSGDPLHPTWYNTIERTILEIAHLLRNHFSNI